MYIFYNTCWYFASDMESYKKLGGWKKSPKKAEKKRRIFDQDGNDANTSMNSRDDKLLSEFMS